MTFHFPKAGGLMICIFDALIECMDVVHVRH